MRDFKPDTKLCGTVLAVQANFYQVKLAQSDFLLLCTRRTRLKKIGQKVMVGDHVIIEEPNYQEGQGVIAEVFPRKTQIERPPIANADQILLVFALEEPTLEAWQLSRFLVKAESTDLELCLCLNKTDLISPKEQQEWENRLISWGYQPLLVSVVTHQGIEQLLTHLSQKITILAGLSGVGKSSLINYLIPSVQQRVGQVSGKLQKGRHTTRHVELFELPGRGLLADTPGFNQPELDCCPIELAYYFPEAKKRLEVSQCQFNDCLHRDEPNCVVRGNWERYEHYLSFLEEAIAQKSAIEQTPDEESTLKLKIKGTGQAKYEPKLESKKYRRGSRREKRQLQERYENQTLKDIVEEEPDW